MLSKNVEVQCDSIKILMTFFSDLEKNDIEMIMKTQDILEIQNKRAKWKVSHFQISAYREQYPSKQPATGTKINFRHRNYETKSLTLTHIQNINPK